MIKFFRKIRQKMLTENKFSKYLIYAVGEIILVVIGILIALQINNFNEARKARAIEINYLENLKADLLLESKNVEGYSEYHLRKAESCAYLLNTDLPETIEDAFIYTEKVEVVSYWFGFIKNNNTYKELMSSGNFSLIKNDSIKNAFLSLDRNYELISMLELNMRREFEKLIFNRSVENTESLIFIDKSKPQYGHGKRLTIDDIPRSKHHKIITDVQWLYNDQTFNNGLRHAFTNNSYVAGVHQNIGEEIENLLILIDEEIEK